jgi:hypothetical protein
MSRADVEPTCEDAPGTKRHNLRLHRISARAFRVDESIRPAWARGRTFESDNVLRLAWNAWAVVSFDHVELDRLHCASTRHDRTEQRSKDR